MPAFGFVHPEYLRLPSKFISGESEPVWLKMVMLNSIPSTRGDAIVPMVIGDPVIRIENCEASIGSNFITLPAMAVICFLDGYGFVELIGSPVKRFQTPVHLFFVPLSEILFPFANRVTSLISLYLLSFVKIKTEDE